MARPTLTIDLESKQGFNLDNFDWVTLKKGSKMRVDMVLDGTLDSLSNGGIESKLSLLKLTSASGVSIMDAQLKEVSVRPGGKLDAILQRKGRKAHKISQGPSISGWVRSSFTKYIRQNCDILVKAMGEKTNLCSILGV
jgi:hypothetical protein